MKNKDKKIEVSEAELMGLKKAMSYLDTIMDNSMDVIVLTDSKGYILKVNKYFLELLGYKQDEVVGEHIANFGPKVNTTYTITTGESVHIGDKFFEETWKMYERFVEEKKTINWQSYFVSKKDVLIPVEENMSFFHDEKGNIVGSLAIIRDTTDRRKAEKEIESANKYLENIFRTSADGIMIADSEGKIVAVNKAAEKIFDCSSDQLVGKHTSELEYHEVESQISGIELMERLMSENTISGVERTVKKPDGTKVVVEMNIALLKDDEESIKGSVVSIRDITERKMAEVALLKSEEKYRGLVNNIGIGVSLISPNMEILSLNNQMQQWFPEADVSKKPICYKTFNNPPKERVCSYCPTFKTLQDGQVHESITDTPQEDKILHYRIISSPLKDKKGKITSAIEMVEDITEQKAAQEKLLYYQKQLKTLTSQITLTEEKERKRFAEYLHDEIGQYLFASQIQLGRLKDALDATEHGKSLDDVINNIRQIIDKSRSLTFEISSPILYELGLEKALEWLVENIYKQYNLVVTLADDNQEKPLDDDIKMFLYQAVRELLTNVAKHAQTQNAILSIKKENSNIRICVEDNGVGFDRSQENSLNNSNNRFGLFHISERIEQFGGQIDIKSQPNCGTQITLVAPLKNSV